MNISKSRIASIVLLVLSMATGAFAPASAGEGATVFLNSRVPIACEASIVASNVVSITPLLINAAVRQTCNATHDLSVTYTPLSVIAPNLLFITLDGAAPNTTAPGAKTFTTLPPTASDKPLSISYAAGTRAQRQELARSLGIAVGVH